ncbi:pantoate--beta-alanine ligase [Polaribacter tangerinus]|uniref:pantoate--beta-alanine ligase n=1 Tax=Polaribacter tangerinus TaxID=1920034 RepID=UPI000B4AC2CB|nr:pantoate--beta-alanine ligase [Polaribacter tangerinus]
MKIFNTKKDITNCLLEYKTKKQPIGFVPTMGALHQGHLSLIKEAKAENEVVVVSIFVNPTQFDNSSDLEKYPKTLEKDIELLKSINCDFLFAPTVDEIYAENIISESFNFDGLEHQMEGEFRTGHFNGVGTIVKALFQIIMPNNAYFGEKDFQQLQIVKKMTEQQKLPVVVKGCEIYREKDGLAMSSRNVRLTKEHRKAAPFIYKTLLQVQTLFTQKSILEINSWVKKEFEKQPLLKLEYFCIANTQTLQAATNKKQDTEYRAFMAVFAGEIRLIDNIKLENCN